MSNLSKIALLACSVSILATCGSVSEIPNTEEETPPDDLTWVKSSIGANYAADNGITGKGVTIAIIDTGIDWSHDAFINANIAGNYGTVIDCRQEGWLCNNDGTNLEISDENGHGTSMASTIVGAYTDGTVFGVAPEASILNVDASSESDGSFWDYQIADGIYYAVDADADIISMSLGTDYSTALDYYTMQELRELDDVQAISYATSNGVIVVMAAGNNGEYYSGFPAYFAGDDLYNGLGIGVAALDENDEIAWFSNSCNTVDPTYCISAPGMDVVEADIDGGYVYGSGTSQATAIVSGSFALIKEYWPELTPEEIVQIVLLTADDLGEVGVDEVYGSGKINIEQAMQPIGTPNLANSQSTNEFSNAQIQTTSAMSNSFSNVAAFSDIPVYDDFNRDYALNLENPEYLKTSAQDKLSDEDRYMITADFTTEVFDQSLTFAAGYGDLSDWNSEHDSLVNVNTASTSNPFLSIAPFDMAGQVSRSDNRSATSLSYFGNTDADYDNSLAMISHTQQLGRFSLSGGLSRFNETGQALGLEISSGFGEIASAETDSVHIGLGWENLKFGFDARASFSNTDVNMKTAGLITDFDEISSRSLAVGAHVNSILRQGDRIDFGVARSLAVIDGNANLDATAIADGVNSTVSLTPNGQETTYEIGYRAPITENIALIANASYLTESYNDIDAEDETNFGIRAEFTF